MDKNLFRKTEKRLYDYYESEDKLKRYEEKINVLESNISELEHRVKGFDIIIPIESKSITFEEKVQSAGDGTSYAERMMLSKIEKLEKEIDSDKNAIYELEDIIRRVKKNRNIMDIQLRDLGKEYIDYLELKYRDKLKNWQIANNLNISDVTCTRFKNEVVESIAKWEESLFF